MIERFMLVIGPISTLFDMLTFGVLLLLFRATVIQFRSGLFIEFLVTEILMIFAVRTHHHLFASRPHVAVSATLPIAGISYYFFLTLVVLRTWTA
jgi:Mg2+-importing ATPase